MHQDGGGYFRTSKKQKVWCFTRVIATFSEASDERRLVDAMSIDDNDVTYED